MLSRTTEADSLGSITREQSLTVSLDQHHDAALGSKHLPVKEDEAVRHTIHETLVCLTSEDHETKSPETI